MKRFSVFGNAKALTLAILAMAFAFGLTFAACDDGTTSGGGGGGGSGNYPTNLTNTVWEEAHDGYSRIITFTSSTDWQMEEGLTGDTQLIFSGTYEYQREPYYVFFIYTYTSPSYSVFLGMYEPMGILSDGRTLRLTSFGTLDGTFIRTR